MRDPISGDVLHLAQHQRTHHKQKLNKVGRNCVKVQTYQHQKPHTGEKPYRGSVWRTSFVKRCESRVSGEPLVFCEVGKDFLPGSGLCQQEATHTGEKTNSETKQRPPFQRKKLTRALENARKPSAPNRWYVCNDCGKSYSKRSSFNNHQRVHTRERLYNCGECGKLFYKKTHLLVHQSILTGERPYVECESCGKFFRLKNHFIQHQRVHTGERPFKCNECGKAFTHSSELRVCQRVHTGRKPCECSEGRNSFAENSTLTKHRRVHTGERPYKCSECRKSFAETSSFINQDFPRPPKKDFKLCGFYLQTRYYNNL
ncbi:zinc finger protein 552-like [Eulemur rufifrons]|uniref:zinc finger protein 552-like n=1 Tax=Eulemur rufifrons TaxID=859984 RepID=UPI00374280FF